jgi:hypothetical protein
MAEGNAALPASRPALLSGDTPLQDEVKAKLLAVFERLATEEDLAPYITRPEFDRDDARNDYVQAGGHMSTFPEVLDDIRADKYSTIQDAMSDVVRVVTSRMLLSACTATEHLEAERWVGMGEMEETPPRSSLETNFIPLPEKLPSPIKSLAESIVAQVGADMGYIHPIQWPTTDDRRLLTEADAEDFSMRRTLTLHRRLLSLGNVKPFAEPVPTDLVEYHHIIHCPMDLGTILAKLEDNSIQSLTAYTQLVRRVFTNARIFNRPGSHLFNASLKLEAWFNNEICLLADRARVAS